MIINTWMYHLTSLPCTEALQTGQRNYNFMFFLCPTSHTTDTCFKQDIIISLLHTTHYQVVIPLLHNAADTCQHQHTTHYQVVIPLLHNAADTCQHQCTTHYQLVIPLLHNAADTCQHQRTTHIIKWSSPSYIMQLTHVSTNTPWSYKW